MAVRLLRYLVAYAFLLILKGCSDGSSDGSGPDNGSIPRLGFTLFPYDVSNEAKVKTKELALRHSNTVLFHQDNGVPWAEALADSPFPEGVEAAWKKDRDGVDGGHTIVLALTPTSQSRDKLAPSLIAPEETGPLPAAFDGKPFNDPLVKAAFLNYSRRLVAIFQPDFLIIGIEITGLAKAPVSQWGAITELLRSTRAELKKEYPNLPIGVEHIVQSLLDEATAETARPFLNDMDFLGLSFYPYSHELGVLNGEPEVPAPP